MYIYLYMYKYIYMYIFIYMHINIYVYIYMCVYIYICIYICVYIFTSAADKTQDPQMCCLTMNGALWISWFGSGSARTLDRRTPQPTLCENPF